MQRDISTQDIEGIDLFCGVGGLSYGLVEAGIKIKAGIDLDPACRYPYEKNLQAVFIEENVRETSADSIKAFYSENAFKLLAGCAPCQPFSTMAHAKRGSQDDKWSLLDEFTRLVKEVQPDFVTMENVPGVKKYAPFQSFLTALKDLKYFYDWKVVNCSDIGVPQRRLRLVLVASKHGEIKIDIPKGAPVSVRSAIGHLPTITAGEGAIEDPLHKARSLSEVNMRRIRASKPGGTWKDWPVELRSPCHQKPEGESYSSVYARMEWDKPSPTITTQSYTYGTGRFGHPEQDRALSLREAALLQSFPEDYEFAENEEDMNFTRTGRLIGNAVPPKLGKFVGDLLRSHLQNIK